jgi:glycosyltransferase involved in cell wall biosynthesis
MKVLLLSRYGRRGASSRIRSYQYLPFLETQGIEVTVSPLFPDSYLQGLYSEQRIDVRSVLQAYYRRAKSLLKSGQFDLLWVEYEILPWLPDWVEQILALFKIPYLVDYDDAIFHRYDMHPRGVVRAFLGKKIDRVMRRAVLVIAGNQYLAERAWKSGARQVAILPSVVDLDRYSIPEGKARDVFTVGWIGSPTTSAYLNLVAPAVEEFARDRKVRIVLVGSGRSPINGLPVEIREWSEETEVKDIKDFDVGIMPLPDDPWSQGKCGYKLVQYMACTVPVVASPVGVNEEMIHAGLNGFLAEGKDDWLGALKTLYNSASLREEMGKAGRALVEEKFSLQVTAPRLLAVLRSAAGDLGQSGSSGI